MRILHVILGLADVWGGPPHALATIARAQARRGDDVTVLPCVPTPGRPTLPQGRSGRLSVLAPPITGSVKFYSPRLKQAIRDAARGCDLIHVHGTWRYHLLAAAAVARRQGIPYIVRPAGNLGEVCRARRWYLKRPYFELFERRVINRAAAIHCTSRKESDELAPLGLRVRTFIVPQAVEIGVDSDPQDGAEPTRQCPVLDAPDRPAVVFIGRILEMKGLEVLVEAFIRLAGDFPDWRLVIAGYREDEAYAAGLERRAAAAGVSDRVCLPGMIRGGAKAALLGRATIYAQPSRHENFGISVAEALHAGAPCIVSTGVALGADIAEHDAGLAVPGQVEPFERALRTLMTDASLRRRQSENARRLAARFSPEAVAEGLDREYRICVEGRAGGPVGKAAPDSVVTHLNR